MDTEDPQTKYYLQMIDEVIEEEKQKRGTAAATGSLEIAGSKTSEATYEGDDELDESEGSGSRAEKKNTQGMQKQNLDILELAVSDEDSPQQGAGIDFVHVHLEHLPSHEEIQDNASPSQKEANSNNGLFLRKFATEGSCSPQNNENTQTSSNVSTTASERARLAAKDWELPRQPTTPYPQTLSSENNSHATQRQQALQGQFQTNPQPNMTLNRQQALQGNLAATSDWTSASTIRDHILQQEDFDFVNMDMIPSNEESTTHHNSKKKNSRLAEVDKGDTTDACSTTYDSNVDDTSLGEPKSSYSAKRSAKVDFQRKNSPSNNSLLDTPKRQIQTKMAQNKTSPKASSPRSNGSSRSNTSPRANNSPRTPPRNHKETRAVVPDNHPDDGSFSQSETYTSDADNSWKQRQCDRKARLLQRRDEKIRMTLAQTLQHNTRANFCGIFLLCVALATLILCLVAKWYTTTGSSASESMFYDATEDQNFVVTNNDQLLTVEVLTFALILVLLLGSVCYLGAVSCQSNEALIRAVKHEDACLANSSARRKSPTYKAPYVEGSPSRRYGTPSGGHDKRPMRRDDDDHQSNTSNDPDIYGNFHHNQTFSMLSNESASDYIGRQDEILISMEEADRYYRDLQEEDAGCCCSPIPNGPSVEDPTDYSAA